MYVVYIFYIVGEFRV